MNPNKIFLYGTPGVGKSTSSREITRRLNLPKYELDLIKISAQKSTTKDKDPFVYLGTCQAWQAFGRKNIDNAKSGLNAVRQSVIKYIRELYTQNEGVFEGAFIDPFDTQKLGQTILIIVQSELVHRSQFFKDREVTQSTLDEFEIARMLQEYLKREALNLGVRIWSELDLQRSRLDFIDNVDLGRNISTQENEKKEKAETILKKLVTQINFNSFTHYIDFYRHFQQSLNIEDGLDSWNYLSSTSSGFNCLDFCRQLKIDLDLQNIESRVIGRMFNRSKFTEAQLKHLSKGHFAVIITIDGQEYLAEPSLRHTSLISINNGCPSIDEDREILILDPQNDGFYQIETNLKTKKSGTKRYFEKTEISLEQLRIAQTKILQIPRNLELVSKLDGTPRSYIQFLSDSRTFQSNILWLDDEFIPSSISGDQNHRLSEIFEIDDLRSFLYEFYQSYINLPNSFWI